MPFIRPVREKDLDQLYSLAKKASKGLTTLPADRDFLAGRIQESIKAFSDMRAPRGEDYYLLVLEDEKTEKIIGTSGIFASVGQSKPFYNYKVLKLTQVSADPELRIDTSLLTLANDYTGASELATLFLDPDYRAGGNGRLLSKARYMLIAGYPERFSPTVMAELRGWVNDKNESPFWDALGRHFFGMSLMEADRINGLGNSQFIADLMPKYPIYTNLLPKAAQEVIGKPHRETAPAMKLLMSEGFRFRGAVDIFDAGPCLEASRDQIRAVRECRPLAVKKVDHVKDAPLCMISSADPFRVVSALAKRDGKQLMVTRDVLETLKIKEGDTVLSVPMEGTWV